MNLHDKLRAGERAVTGYMAKVMFGESMRLERASAKIVHRRARKLIKAESGLMIPDPALGMDVLHEQTQWNVITTVGRDFIHTQSYGTSPAGNGLNYIALSNDTLTETSASTTLSTEIAANGLTRAIGAVVHTTSATTTTVDKTFTATGAQAAQKTALFTASSVGIMNHVLAFTQRSLAASGDTLQITFTLTIS